MSDEYYGGNDYRDYLSHYGVKGMKWKNHQYATEEIVRGGVRMRVMRNRNGKTIGLAPSSLSSIGGTVKKHTDKKSKKKTKKIRGRAGSAASSASGGSGAFKPIVDRSIAVTSNKMVQKNQTNLMPGENLSSSKPKSSASSGSSAVKSSATKSVTKTVGKLSAKTTSKISSVMTRMGASSTISGQVSKLINSSSTIASLNKKSQSTSRRRKK